MRHVDRLIVAVPQAEYLDGTAAAIVERLNEGVILVDGKGTCAQAHCRALSTYWSLRPVADREAGGDGHAGWLP